MSTERSTYEVTATRKRPQDFDRLVGQDFVVSTLENAIRENRIAHAYLFSGPRGVGKTSSARLLAKSLNCEKGMSAHPCGECESCRAIAKGSSVDVIEIDGASNTSVNDIRAIKEEIMFPPQSSRYKIYIIDEVHMLSTSAFNALLKTIEEPPEYIIFIFATTELQKVPATIRSRCQQFRFQLISQELIMKCLASAAEDIGAEADEDALFWIAKEATGSMRDAYTLFDQVAAFSGDHITLQKIREKLAIAGFSAISAIISSVLSGDLRSAHESLAELFADGVSAEQITKDAADYFRTLLLYKEGIRRTDILGSALQDIPENIAAMLSREQLEAALKAFLSLYRDLRYSLSPRFEIELLFSRLASLPMLTSPEILVRKIEDLKNGVAEGRIVVKKTVERIIEAPVREAAPARAAENHEEPARNAPARAEVPEPLTTPQEEPIAAEEEIPYDSGPSDDVRIFTLKDIPEVAEMLSKMGKAAAARYLEAVEKIEENDDGSYFLILSKALAYNSLKLSEKELSKAIAAVMGCPVSIRLKLEEKKEITDEDFSEDMRRLKGFLGGKLIRVSEPKTADMEAEDTEEDKGADSYESIRDVEADELDQE